MSITLKENEIAFAKIRETAIIPTKKLEDAGYDIYANFEEDFLLFGIISLSLKSITI